MALIVLEDPTGTVDGVNKVFTTTQDIFQIVEINVDGVTYLGTITITGPQEFTLADAPSSFIYITYYDTVAVNPAYSGPTVSLAQAYQALKNQLKDISDVPMATFIQWCEYINDFTYRYLLGVDPDRFIKTVPFNILAGQEAYSIPADFRDMSAWNTGFFITSNNGSTPTYTTSQRLPLSGPGQSFPGYYINRGYFIFTPTPQQNNLLTQTYTVKNARLSTIDQYFSLDGSANGIPIIELEYLRYVVNALVSLYFVWDEEVGAESFSDQRLERTLDELCDNIRRQPSSMGMIDFSGIYGGGGTNGGWGYGGWF